MEEYQLETVPLSCVYVLTYKISHTLMGLVLSFIKYRCVIQVFGLLHSTSYSQSANFIIISVDGKSLLQLQKQDRWVMCPFEILQLKGYKLLQ